MAITKEATGEARKVSCFIRRKREERKWWWLMHLRTMVWPLAVRYPELSWLECTYHPHLHKWICNDNALQKVFIDFV